MMSKKNLSTKFVLAVFFLLSGVEYGVIIPTLWPYLEELGADHRFYGVTFSAYCISGLAIAMIFGAISDKVHKTKSLVMLAIACQVAGDVLYFIASSANMVLGGRFLAGVGMGGGSVIYTMLAWTSSDKDRTSSFSLAIAMRNIGIILGPGLNILFLHINFYLGPYHIHPNNVAGFFMASLWTFNLLLMPCMYFDPQVSCWSLRNTGNTAPELPKLDRKANSSRLKESNISSEETESLLCANGDIQYNCKLVKSDSRQEEGLGHCYTFVNQYVRDEIVVLFAIQFVQFFNQCGLESFIPPFTKDTFGWSIFNSSLLFMAAAVIIVVVYMILRCLKGKVSDRSVIVVGLLLDICGIAVLVGFVPGMKPHSHVDINTTIFVVGCVLVMMGYPAILIATAGLLSKLTSMSWQGRTQAVRRVITNVGMIMGPLWSGSLMDNLYIMLPVMLTLLVYVSLLAGLSFTRLHEYNNQFFVRNRFVF